MLQKLKVVVLLPNRKVPGSNPGPDTILAEMFWFSSVSLGKFRDNTSAYAPFPAISFLIYYSLVTIIRFDIVCATKSPRGSLPCSQEPTIGAYHKPKTVSTPPVNAYVTQVAFWLSD
jgi:hypothetical protein